MILTQDKLEEIRLWGRNCIPAEKMAIMLQLSRDDKELFIFEFEDPDSEIRLMWEEGKTKAEIEVMDSLEQFTMKDEEGSGEAAKALGWMKSKQRLNQLKSNLFGI